MENEIYKELDAPLNELSESIAVYLSSEGIREISSADLDIIIRKSAYSLPTRPSDAGMSPEQIKAAFFRPFTDAEKSLAAEINRVAREADGKSNNLAELVGRIKDILVSVIAENKEWAQQLYNDNKSFKKALEEELKSYLKRIDGEAGIEYAYAQRDGEGSLKPMSLSPTAESIALRGEGGRLKAGSPVEDDDVVTKGYADGTHYGASQIFASALKGSASGEAVALKDVSPLEHNLGVRVESKNKINAPDKTVSGTTAWCAEKLGSYTLPNGTYTISCGVEKSASAVPGLKLQRLKDGSDFKEHTDVSNGKMTTSFTVDDSLGGGIIIYLYSNLTGNAVETSCTYSNIQVELGTKATPYTPYIADTSGVKLLVQGGNLIPYPYTETTKTVNGITFTDNGDGTITANGTATSQAVFYLLQRSNMQIAQDAFLSGCPAGGSYSTYFLEVYNGNTGYKADTGRGVLIPKDTIRDVYIVFKAGATVENVTFKPQVEIGTTATDYERYIAPVEYTVNADGTVDGLKSIAPSTTLMTDTAGALITVEYNKDANKVVKSLEDRISALEAAVISQ